MPVNSVNLANEIAIFARSVCWWAMIVLKRQWNTESDSDVYFRSNTQLNTFTSGEGAPSGTKQRKSYPFLLLSTFKRTKGGLCAATGSCELVNLLDSFAVYHSFAKGTELSPSFLLACCTRLFLRTIVKELNTLCNCVVYLVKRCDLVGRLLLSRQPKGGTTECIRRGGECSWLFARPAR